MILITGAGGFAGSHLVALCAERGEPAVGLGRGERPEIAGLAGWERLDLADADTVRQAVARVRPERVVHLAAEASVARSWQDPAAIISANVQTTLNLLEAIRLEAADAAVLVACSGEEYGPPERLPVDETARLRPRNPYAASKAMVDVLAGSYADAHELRVIRTRAFNHAGPGQSDTYVVASFARQIAEAEAAGVSEVTLATGNLNARRDFSDVRDVVRAYWLALERAEPGAYNVCSGRATAVSDILTGLAGHSSLEITWRADPSRMRDNEVMEIAGSHEKLTQATGWRPEIDLSQTLRDVLDWWRDRVRAGVSPR